jgi:hypothetical protein
MSCNRVIDLVLIFFEEVGKSDAKRASQNVNLLARFNALDDFELPMLQSCRLK